MRIPLASFGGLILAAGLAAQPAPHPTTNPKAFTGVFTGWANTSFPLGRSGGLIQYWRRGTDFSTPQVFTSVGSRPTRSLSAAPVTLNSVELTMSNSPATYQTLSGTFAQNFGTQTTIVFTRKPVNLPALNGGTDPDQPVAWLMYDAPFVFLGPNLIVQFDLGTAVGSAALGRTADAVPGGIATHLSSAASCGGTLTASGAGTVYSLALQGAPANGVGVLMLARENVLLGGAPVLPFMLDGIGMTGCFLGVDPLVMVAFLADSGGGMVWNLPVNYTTASNPDAVHAQVLHATTANPVGWGTTNATHSVLGGTGLATYAYNYTRDGPVAEFGPYVGDRGGILLFRP